MNQQKFLLAAVLILGLSAPRSASADVIQYKDEAGRSYFVDHPDKVPEKYRSQISAQKELPAISRSNPGREQLYEKQHYAQVQESVEVFVTSWCPYCGKLEAFLKSRGVPFTRYDIEKDKNGKKLHDALGGGGVPLTRVGKKVIHGFNESQFEALFPDKKEKRERL